MGYFARLAGIVGNLFQLGGAGAANTTVLANQTTAPATTTGVEMRNSANTAFVNARGLDPIVPQDFATKNYVDTSGSVAPAVQEIRLPIALVNVSTTTSLPANSVVNSCELDITTLYSAGATITVGNSSSSTAYMGTADSTPQVVNLYGAPQDTVNTSASVINVVIAGAPTTGAGFLIVRYVQTPKV